MSVPRVVVRADGGPAVGLGHVRRSLTLAGALRGRGAAVVCVVPDERGLRAIVEAEGVPVELVGCDEALRLEATRGIVQRLGAALAVVDSYEAREEAFEEPVAPVTVVIDDLADRGLPVDCVVNGLVGAEMLAYRVAPRTRLLLGARYALLRPAFAGARRSLAERVQRILITMGGGDAAGLVPRLIAVVHRTLGDVAVDVVVGPFSANRLAVERAARAAPARVRVHRDPVDMASLMRAADLAISGGGQTTYELAATGTAAVAIRLADNQAGTLAHMAAAGTLVVAGAATDPDLDETVSRVIGALASDVERRRAMSERGPAVVDGRGAERVAAALLDLCAERRA